jgi:hypothetical protein
LFVYKSDDLSGAWLSARTPPTSDSGNQIVLITVRHRFHDTAKVICKAQCRLRHVRKTAIIIQKVPQVCDPGIAHLAKDYVTPLR